MAPTTKPWNVGGYPGDSQAGLTLEIIFCNILVVPPRPKLLLEMAIN